MPQVKLCRICFMRIREDQDWWPQELTTGEIVEHHVECIENQHIKWRQTSLRWRRWWKDLFRWRTRPSADR